MRICVIGAPMDLGADRRGVDIGAIKRLAIVGKIFRWLAAVSWEGASLLPRYEERPIRRMRYYHDQLAAAIKELQ